MATTTSGYNLASMSPEQMFERRGWLTNDIATHQAALALGQQELTAINSALRVGVANPQGLAQPSRSRSRNRRPAAAKT